ACKERVARTLTVDEIEPNGQARVGPAAGLQIVLHESVCVPERVHLIELHLIRAEWLELVGAIGVWWQEPGRAWQGYRGHGTPTQDLPGGVQWDPAESHRIPTLD